MQGINLFCALAAIAAPALFTSTISAAAQDKDNQVVIGELCSSRASTVISWATRNLSPQGRMIERAGTSDPSQRSVRRRPGSLPDYEYSEAMVAFGCDKVWDDATLTTFLHDPSGVVAGTRINYPGNKKDEELQALLAYLATFDPDGMAPK